MRLLRLHTTGSEESRTSACVQRLSAWLRRVHQVRQAHVHKGSRRFQDADFNSFVADLISKSRGEGAVFNQERRNESQTWEDRPISQQGVSTGRLGTR